jgi:glucosamine-6-phosphate deaminase
MKIIEASDCFDVGRQAAGIVVRQLRSEPDSLLTFATGNTPVPMFRALVAAATCDAAVFARARVVTLDEYAGIAVDDRRRLLSWLRRELLGPAGIDDDRITAFDPSAEPAGECRRIEAAISSQGGIDLAVLGLGPNGHVGFNEPGSAFRSRTRRVALAAESIVSNAAYWGSEADVPRHGLTLGLATILEARSILLIVCGSAKARVVSRLLKEPISEALPATALRAHPSSTLLADRPALLGLPSSALG